MRIVTALSLALLFGLPVVITPARGQATPPAGKGNPTPAQLFLVHLRGTLRVEDKNDAAGFRPSRAMYVAAAKGADGRFKQTPAPFDETEAWSIWFYFQGETVELEVTSCGDKQQATMMEVQRYRIVSEDEIEASASELGREYATESWLTSKGRWKVRGATMARRVDPVVPAQPGMDKVARELGVTAKTAGIGAVTRILDPRRGTFSIRTTYVDDRGQPAFHHVVLYRRMTSEEKRATHLWTAPFPPGAEDFSLGWKYHTGQGVKQDQAEAFRLFLKAAEAGHPNAQHNLGVMLREGNGTAKDPVAALAWTRKSAEQGSASGQFAMGECLQYGYGRAIDPPRALSWYRKAADQEFAKAQFTLGDLYCLGQLGLAKDEAVAASWYLKAAEQGDAMAQHNVGACYMHGTGLPKDRAQAKAWFEKAAAQGYERSINALKQIR